jgi:tripartite-type tricarboxylate transporter receptor subunit TctC
LKIKKREETVMKKIFSVLGMSIVLILSMAHASFAAGDYPNRPITIICPFTPGGLSDLQARAIAMAAEKYLGQPIVVVSKAGAAGMIGVLAGAQAAPDGYTLTITQSSITCVIESEIAEGRKPPFTRNDFTTIASFTLTPSGIVVAYDHPWKSMADLVRDCKAHPNQYKYGSSGLNSALHISVEMISAATGIKVRQIPYKGAADAVTAVIGRHVDFSMGTPLTIRSLMDGKKVRSLALCSSTPQRARLLPDLPTLQELGIDAGLSLCSGLLVPRKTPEDVVKKLREVAEKVSKDKQFVDLIEKAGDEINFKNGDEFAKFWGYESDFIAKTLQRLAKEVKEKEPSK